jgi:uncharacterized protein YjiS (DUF1127 family)
MRAGTGERASLAHDIRASATYLVRSVTASTGRNGKSSEVIIVEAMLSASTLLHGGVAQSVRRSVERTLTRWWAAYAAWRMERQAIAELLQMSDRDLRDIGINRCDIPRAVRGHIACERTSVRDAMPIAGHRRLRVMFEPSTPCDSWLDIRKSSSSPRSGAPHRQIARRVDVAGEP